MKKLFALAALVLGLASCQTEPEGFGVVTGGEVDTVVTVSLPAATRSSEQSGLENIDLGTYDLRYIFEVYDAADNAFVIRQEKQCDDTTVTFPVRLIPSRDYYFVVWADFVKGDKACYNVASLTNVSIIEETWTAMNEVRDAYTGVIKVENYNGSKQIDDIVLTRPFGKLRVVTTDMDALTKLNNSGLASVKVTYNTQVGTAFNALRPEVTTPVYNKEFTYDLTNAGVYDETGNNLTLFADYIFAQGTSAINFNMVVTYTDGKTSEVTFNTDIPVVRNQLTTIIGSILTDANDVKVVVDDKFAAKNTILDVFENGGEYTLTENIELPANNLIVKKNVVLNLGGYTINAGKPDSAEMSGTDIAAITVVDGATLTIEGAGTIKGTEYGVYVKNGNVVIKGGNFVAGTSAVQVYNGTATIEGGKFEATKSDVYVVNCIDANWKNGTAKVAIKGGQFVDFNPANNAAEGVGTCFVADGYISVPAEDNCFEAVEFAGEITLSADITSAKSLVVAEGKSLKLNLGEFDIINAGATEDLGVADAIIVYGELEINGEGTVKGNTRSVWARGNTNAKITINGGNYVGAVVDGGCEVIYASGNGKITINGGTFEAANMDDSSFAAPQYAVLNLHGNGAAGCDIEVYGGSFKNFDPANNISENPKHNFCAEGYTAVANGEWFDVVSWDSLAIDNVEDLKAALAAGQSTINLKGGVVFEGTFTPKVNTTFICHNAENKATIKGRVQSQHNTSFKNIKFQCVSGISNKSWSLSANNVPNGYAAIVMVENAAASFEACDFNMSVAAAINLHSSVDVSQKLTVNNCTFVGDNYPIRTRSNFSITNSTFDIDGPDNYAVCTVFTWGVEYTASAVFSNNRNLSSINDIIDGPWFTSKTHGNNIYNNLTVIAENNENFENDVEFNTTYFNYTNSTYNGNSIK